MWHEYAPFSYMSLCNGSKYWGNIEPPTFFHKYVASLYVPWSRFKPSHAIFSPSLYHSKAMAKITHTHTHTHTMLIQMWGPTTQAQLWFYNDWKVRPPLGSVAVAIIKPKSCCKQTGAPDSCNRREFLKPRANFPTLMSGMTDRPYIIFFTTLYDIIFQWWS